MPACMLSNSQTERTIRLSINEIINKGTNNLCEDKILVYSIRPMEAPAPINRTLNMITEGAVAAALS